MEGQAGSAIRMPQWRLLDSSAAPNNVTSMAQKYTNSTRDELELPCMPSMPSISPRASAAGGIGGNLLAELAIERQELNNNFNRTANEPETAVLPDDRLSPVTTRQLDGAPA